MSTIDKNQYLAIGVNGTYSTSGKYQSSFEQVLAIVEHLKNTDTQELTLYIHGGLVAEEGAEQSITRVFGALESRHLPHAQALGLIWKTGFTETIQDNLKEIFTTKFGENLLKWVIRAVSKKLMVDSIKAPGAQGLKLEEIEEEWELAGQERRRPFAGMETTFATKAKGSAVQSTDEEDAYLVHIVQAELEWDYLHDPNPLESWGEIPEAVTVEPELKKIFHASEPKTKGLFSALEIARVVAKVATRVIRRYMNKTDHGLQATVVEEACRAYFISDAGQWIWGEMKAKADEMWQQEGRVGFDFLRLLQQEIPGIRLNLVGHSAGSICIAHLLRRIREEQWNVAVDKILWLAPSCSCELFVNEVVEHQGDYNAFRMITMADRYELDDNLVNDLPWVYPSSLLYFISGVLEANADYPLCGMARYHIASEPYTGSPFMEVQEFLGTSGRLALSKTDAGALPGFRSHAIDHGSFNEDDLTLSSVTEFLQ